MEILAVVFIASLIVTLVVTNIDSDTDDITYLEARKFAALTKHLADESIILGQPMGVLIDSIQQRYAFTRFEDNGSWLQRIPC